MFDGVLQAPPAGQGGAQTPINFYYILTPKQPTFLTCKSNIFIFYFIDCIIICIRVATGAKMQNWAHSALEKIQQMSGSNASGAVTPKGFWSWVNHSQCPHTFATRSGR